MAIKRILNLKTKSIGQIYVNTRTSRLNKTNVELGKRLLRLNKTNVKVEKKGKRMTNVILE